MFFGIQFIYIVILAAAITRRPLRQLTRNERLQIGDVEAVGADLAVKVEYTSIFEEKILGKTVSRYLRFTGQSTADWLTRYMEPVMQQDSSIRHIYNMSEELKNQEQNKQLAVEQLRD